MGKHAYLIMAHKNDYTFHTLLRLLDDERNVIFIHMDKKVKNYDPASIQSAAVMSEIIHIPQRWNVQWGSDKLVFLELMLLETALSYGKFDCYHLISGQDLPIKSQDEIHSFFDLHSNTEFFDFMEGDYSDRVRYYYSLQNMLGKKDGFLSHINGLYIRIQKILGIHRNKDVVLVKGSQWFTITDACANYIVSQKERIQHIFHSSYGADELFLQTIIYGTEFFNRRYQAADGRPCVFRYIDWSDEKIASPKVFRMTDREKIASSKDMFARKFDSEIDKEIIDYVAENLAVTKE